MVRYNINNSDQFEYVTFSPDFLKLPDTPEILLALTAYPFYKYGSDLSPNLNRDHDRDWVGQQLSPDNEVYYWAKRWRVRYFTDDKMIALVSANNEYATVPSWRMLKTRTKAKWSQNGSS